MTTLASVTARWSILLLVFVGGCSSLAAEFGASRLVAPYFGDSLYVWGVLIGLILIYLSVGYWVGGRVADRWPRATLLFEMTGVAGLWIGLVPLVSYPILQLSLHGFATLSAGLVLGTLLSIGLLFAVPVILLGCVTPFAIRLLLREISTGGNTAGQIYALSTAGSIVGTFVPVFILIPTFGTRATLIGFGVVLLVTSGVGLLGRPWRLGGAGLLVLIVLGTSMLIPPRIKPPPYGTELFETESAYNYIQVVRYGSQVQLILNEGQAVHSIYDPTQLATGGYWDDMLLAPDFRPAASSEVIPHRILILGLAGGTIARQYQAAYGTRVRMTGVELDPEIIKVARRYFALDETNLQVVVGDARYFLATRPASVKYDAILVDVYQQPYIPFYMTTAQFFQLIREHLAPGGTAAVNVGRTQTDYRLVAAIASTMRPVFDGIYLLNPQRYDNTVVYGTTERTSLPAIRHNVRLDRGPLLGEVARRALETGDIRASPYHARPFTDDWAPVENLIDSIIFDVATGREAN